MTELTKELKRISRYNLIGNHLSAMTVLLIVILISLLMEMPFRKMLTTDGFFPLQIVSFLLAELLISLILSVFQIGMDYFHLKLAKGQEIHVSDVFYCVRNNPDRYIIAYFLMLLMNLAILSPLSFAIVLLVTQTISASTVTFGISFGLLSLILGFYFNLSFGMTFFILLDEPELRVLYCFLKSNIIMRGHCTKLLYLFASFIGFDLLCVASFGIGFLWVSPYKKQTIANFYLSLVKDNETKSN